MCKIIIETQTFFIKCTQTETITIWLRRLYIFYNFHHHDIILSGFPTFTATDKCNRYGWHREYRGYLMIQGNGQGASNYICVDARPEKIGTNTNHNGRVFYPVESICGSLPCPPYVNNRELTCAVCTFWNLMQRYYAILRNWWTKSLLPTEICSNKHTL